MEGLFDKHNSRLVVWLAEIEASDVLRTGGGLPKSTRDQKPLRIHAEPQSL